MLFKEVGLLRQANTVKVIVLAKRSLLMLPQVAQYSGHCALIVKCKE